LDPNTTYILKLFSNTASDPELEEYIFQTQAGMRIVEPEITTGKTDINIKFSIDNGYDEDYLSLHNISPLIDIKIEIKDA
jgi:hypothetical protein